jgi:hypothetical protein
MTAGVKDIETGAARLNERKSSRRLPKSARAQALAERMNFLKDYFALYLFIQRQIHNSKKQKKKSGEAGEAERHK